MSKLTGTVRKFGRYSKNQLQKLKIDLSLSMDEEQLQFCADYYRLTERRDPIIGELRLLDTLAAKRTPSPTNLAIDVFTATDAFATETYADLQEKRRTLRPNAVSPITLAEAFTVANDYLEQTGKQHALPHRTLLLEDTHRKKQALADSSCFGISGSRHRLRILQKNGLTGAPNQGDVLVLFLPKSVKNMLHYQKSVSDMLHAMGDTTPWKRLYSVRSGGLLPSLLLQLRAGLEIDITRLSENENMASLLPLTESFTGCHFAVLPGEKLRETCDHAEANGIHAVCFASVKENDRITVKEHSEELFSLKDSFLQSLLHATPVSARLAGEAHREPGLIRHVPTSASSCAYLQNNGDRLVAETAEIHGTLCATAFCEPTSSFYKNAFYTALAPIVTLAASGRNYTEARLAVGLTLPEAVTTSEQAIGSGLSSVLGLFRLQTELGIPAAVTSLLTDAEITHPRLTVYAAAEGKPISATHSAEGNAVYCLRPAIGKHGIPHTDLLRSFLRDLTSRVKSGSVLSARVLCCESITDGLLKMATDELFCRIQDTAIASHGEIPIGVLVETTAPIAGATPIGFVERREEKEEESNFVCPPITSKIWSEHREVVILASSDDADAQMLEEILVQKGAYVRLIEGTASCYGTLSRALLHAHVFVQCPTATLPQSDYVSFALDTLLSAGGAYWVLGQTDAADPRAVVFPKGIPESYLDEAMK